MASGGGRVVSKIPIAVWSCAPGFSDASSRSPLPFPLVLFLLLFSRLPGRPPVRPPAPTSSHPLAAPLPSLASSARPPALRGLSPRFTRASANLFRRLGDGGRRNRSTLYSSRIDRQPRTDMEVLYFPSSHLCVALSEALLSIKRALSWHGLSLFLSLLAAVDHFATLTSTGCLPMRDSRRSCSFHFVLKIPDCSVFQ